MNNLLPELIERININCDLITQTFLLQTDKYIYRHTHTHTIARRKAILEAFTSRNWTVPVTNLEFWTLLCYLSRYLLPRNMYRKNNRIMRDLCIMGKYMHDMDHITKYININPIFIRRATAYGNPRLLDWLHKNNYLFNSYAYSWNFISHLIERDKPRFIKWYFKVFRRRNNFIDMMFKLAIKNGAIRCLNVLLSQPYRPSLILLINMANTVGQPKIATHISTYVPKNEYQS